MEFCGPGSKGMAFGAFVATPPPLFPAGHRHLACAEAFQNGCSGSVSGEPPGWETDGHGGGGRGVADGS
jgi:hypothetical protein